MLHSMWDLPGSEIEPVSSALMDGFFTTEPPGEPPYLSYNWKLVPLDHLHPIPPSSKPPPPVSTNQTFLL